MLVDTHCHVNSKFYGGKTEEVIGRAFEAGLGALVNAGVDAETSGEARRINERFPEAYFSPGIHPGLAGQVSGKDILKIGRLAADEKAVAAGETGLDFFKKTASAAKQARLFRETIRIARENGLPLIVHNREADEEVLEILSEYYSGAEKHPNGVMHCFGGTPEFARGCIGLNFFVSFAGNLTYPGAGGLRRTAGVIPMQRILLETDSPFLAPQPERGRKNEPSFICHTARELARVKGMKLAEVIRAASLNARRAFPRVKTGTGP